MGLAMKSVVVGAKSSLGSFSPFWGADMRYEPLPRDAPLPPALLRLAAVLADIASTEANASTADHASQVDTGRHQKGKAPHKANSRGRTGVGQRTPPDGRPGHASAPGHAEPAD